MEKFITEGFETEPEIKPVFDLENGYRYLQVETLLSLGAEETMELLNTLSDEGILVRTPYDKEILCPACGSHNVSLNYACPYDNSTDIMRDSLIEHLTCGYIDSLATFQKEDQLVCPRCNATLTHGNYRNVGSWNTCIKCGRKLETLTTVHRCRKCGETFTYEEARFEQAYTYHLSDIVKADLTRGIFITSQLGAIFTKNGYTLQIPSPKLTGESGLNYTFNYVAMASDGEIVAVDTFFLSKPPRRTDLMELSGKLNDVKKEFYFLVAPQLGAEMEKLAFSLRINLVQGDTPTDAVNAFSEAFPLARKQKREERKPKGQGLFSRLFKTSQQ